MDRAYDLVLFGATSFVGQITTRNLVSRCADENLSWAIAGRNAEKLESVANETGAFDVPRMVVEAADEDAVRKMVQSAKLVISTVGPYAQYGSMVIEACAQTGTDYCDLSGEPHWMAQMIEAHHETAVSTGARIVHACGFDSIPSDMGTWFTQQAAQAANKQPCNQIELIVKGMSGTASGGTIASMMNMMEEVSEDPSLAKVLSNPMALVPKDQRSKTRQPSVTRVREHKEENLWLAPFVMAATNTKIVHRSNALLDFAYGEDFRYSEEMATGSGPLGMAKAGAMAGGLGGFAGLARLKPTRGLLAKVLPKPGDGPSPKQQEKGFFNIILRGTDADGNVTRTKVTGDRDPGYGSTAKMLTEAAITLLRTSRTNTGGGFWTPAAAMGGPLIDNLEAHAGLTFEVLDS